MNATIRTGADRAPDPIDDAVVRALATLALSAPSLALFSV